MNEYLFFKSLRALVTLCREYWNKRFSHNFKKFQKVNQGDKIKNKIGKILNFEQQKSVTTLVLKYFA